MPRKKTTKKKAGSKMTRRSKSPPRSKIRRNAITVHKQLPPTIIRNAAPARQPESRPDEAEPEAERLSLGDRFRGMNAGHLATGVGALGAGCVLGLVAAGEGWIDPKATGWTLLGTGALSTIAGYLWEWDAVMAAGVGLTTAGFCSVVTQYGVEAYESVEEHAEKKRQERAEKEQAKRLADAQALVAAQQATPQNQQSAPRNGVRLVVIPGHGESAAA